jgi:phosphatidylinositol glycan class B
MKQRKIIFFSVIIFILTAWFSEGFYQWDEHFQVIEFAGLKLGLTDESSLPWEYAAQMRPAIQPLIFYGLYRTSWFLGITDPFFISFLIRFISASVSFLSIFLLFKLYVTRFEHQKLQTAFLLLSFLLWFSVFNSVRFSSEGFGGRIFIIGLALYLMKDKHSYSDYFLTGLLLGVAFLIRYQIAFMLAGFAAWLIFIHKISIKNFAVFCIALIMIFFTGILIDRWFYGEWVLTAWNYFHQNIMLDKASGFGIHPWWFYFEYIFVNAVPPFSLIYILAVLFYVIYKPKDIITWIIVPFLAVHFIIAHKEIRFLFPLLGFLPVMIISSAEMILKKTGDQWMENRAVKIFVKMFWYTNLIMLGIVMFKPADNHISVYKKLYYDYPGQTILYYTDDHPFNRVSKVNLNYYKRKNLHVEHIDSISMIKPEKGTAILFAATKPLSSSDIPYKANLIYTSYPEWLKNFNINDWIGRTHLWYVYEVVRW